MAHPAQPYLRTITVAVGVPLSAVLPMFITGAISVQLGAAFGAGPLAVGLVVAGYALVVLLLSPLVGRRVGPLGISRSLRIAATLNSVALVVAAAAQSIVWLGLATCIAGAGSAFAHPSSNALIAARIPPSRFGIAYAIKQSAIPLGIVISGLAVPVIVIPTNWRVAYALAAVLAVIAGLLVPSGVTPPAGRSEKPVPNRARAGAWLVAAGVGFGALAGTSIGAHAVASAVAVGFSDAVAGLLLFGGGLAGLTVRIIAGVRADRVGNSALLAAAVLMSTGSIGWFLMAFPSPGWFVAGLIIANGLGWGWAGLYHLALARRFPTATAAATGISMTGVAFGMLIGPPLVGAAAQHVSRGLAWSIAALAALAGAICLVFARNSLVESAAEEATIARRTPAPPPDGTVG